MAVSEEPSRSCYLRRHLFHNLIAGDDGDEAQGEAGKGVEDGGEGGAITAQEKVLVHKGGEGGEATTEACDQDELGGRRDLSAKRQPREQTYQETAQDIDRHRPPGERDSHPRLYGLAHEVAGSASEEAADAHKE